MIATIHTLWKIEIVLTVLEVIAQVSKLILLVIKQQVTNANFPASSKLTKKENTGNP